MSKKSIMLFVLIAAATISAACTASTPTAAPPVAPQATVAATSRPASKAPTIPSPSPSTTAAVTSVPASKTRIPGPSPSTAFVATSTPTLPVFSHIYLIVMENKDYGKIVGNSDAPYINSLIAAYGLATNYSGVAHPSEPNYLALFSGSTQGIADDAMHDFDGQNLADQLEARGKTWKAFAQNVPLECFTGETATGGEDGAGTYVRRHEPAISFTDISTSPSRCSNITDFTHFDPAAADFEFIAPNLCNDMHDCSVAKGDAFLRDFVPTILNSRAWQQGGVLFITWDENEGLSGGRVATLVISKAVPKGLKSDVAHDHYSLLRTIEDTWGLGCLDHSCTANNLSEFFHSK